MRPDLEAMAARQHGIFLRSQAVGCGYNDDEIRLHVRRRVWTRVRRGAYVDTAVWAALDDAGRHVVQTRAALLRMEPPAVASHGSAAALTGLPTYGVDLARVHLTRPTRHFGRIRAGVVHHEAALDASDVIEVDGTPCTSLRRTPLDVAREFGFGAGVVCADAALRRGVDPAKLESLAAVMSAWPDSRPVLPVVRFADGGAESPGESLARMVLVAIGLPRPRTQVVFCSGTFVARVDMFIEEYGWVVEFDGRLKYRRRRDDCDPVVDDGEIVWAEKQREDALRGLSGVQAVSRLVWADLFGARREVAVGALRAQAHRLGVPLGTRRAG
ncbi:MAG: hypothetical protein M3165_09145 [Actinomycetota bacterium]|nr:hypothetical protein [Actinomycetota bacterium]